MEPHCYKKTKSIIAIKDRLVYDCLSIDLLSNEVLTLIFSYLDTRELSRSVMRVCRRWRTISCLPCLWLAVNFGQFDARFYDSYVKVLARSTLIESLEVSKVCQNFLRRHVTECSRLRHLVLQCTTGVTRSTFQALLRGCPNLTQLNLSRGTQGCRTLSAPVLLTNWVNLTTLNIESCNWVNSNFIWEVAKKLKKLEYLNLDCNLLPPSILAHLIESLHQTIKQFSIKCETFSAEMRSALHQCSELEDFSVKVLLGPVSLQQDHECCHMTKLQALSTFSCCTRASAIGRIMHARRCSAALAPMQ